MEMTAIILFSLTALLQIAVLLILLFKKSHDDTKETMKESFERYSKSIEDVLRSEALSSRTEHASHLLNMLNAVSAQLAERTKSDNDNFTAIAHSLNLRLDDFREKLEISQKNQREELVKLQTTLATVTDQRLNAIRDTLDAKFKNIQEDNGKRLDEMRRTVDEKLQESVEKRFNESFKTISERLDLVHKGLGEMQTLANGVGDLKKVLSNVKARGNLGELQLAALLEQCLAPDQYVVNAAVKPNSPERVEFAIKMPGAQNDSTSSVLLPVDSKFPVEDYQRLLEAYDNSSPDELKSVQKSFETVVKKCANEIRSKYINPPLTTDFALMFVPSEGLYAEILRRPGLFEHLQHELKIAVVGPSNLLAFLNSLQMGFRTLAIEKRSSEVWSLLGAVKTEFGKFGDILDKTRNKLESAVREIDNAGVRTRAIERKLRTVQELPAPDAVKMLSDEDPEAII